MSVNDSKPPSKSDDGLCLVENRSQFSRVRPSVLQATGAPASKLGARSSNAIHHTVNYYSTDSFPLASSPNNCLIGNSDSCPDQPVKTSSHPNLRESQSAQFSNSQDRVHLDSEIFAQLKKRMPPKKLQSSSLDGSDDPPVRIRAYAVESKRPTFLVSEDQNNIKPDTESDPEENDRIRESGSSLILKSQSEMFELRASRMTVSSTVPPKIPVGYIEGEDEPTEQDVNQPLLQNSDPSTCKRANSMLLLNSGPKQQIETPSHSRSAIIMVEIPDQKIKRTMLLEPKTQLKNIIDNIQRRNPIPSIEDYAFFIKDGPSIPLNLEQTVESYNFSSKTTLVLQRVRLTLNVFFEDRTHYKLVENVNALVGTTIQKIVQANSQKLKVGSYSLCRPLGEETGAILDPNRTLSSYELVNKEALTLVPDRGDMISVEYPEVGLIKKIKFDAKTTFMDVITPLMKDYPIVNSTLYGCFFLKDGNPESGICISDLSLKISSFEITPRTTISFKKLCSFEELKQKGIPKRRPRKTNAKGDREVLSINICSYGQVGVGRKSLHSRFSEGLKTNRRYRGAKIVTPPPVEPAKPKTTPIEPAKPKTTPVEPAKPKINNSPEKKKEEMIVTLVLGKYQLNFTVKCADVESELEGASIIFLCYDMINPASLQLIEEKLPELVYNAYIEDITLVLVGLKSDLNESLPDVQAVSQRAKRLSVRSKIPLIETSAHKGTNVVELFNTAAELWLVAPRLQQAEDTKTLDFSGLGFVLSSLTWECMRQFGFSHVEHLNMQNNDIISIRFVEHFPSLKSLDLTMNSRLNALVDLPALERLPCLETLHIDGIPHDKKPKQIFQILREQSKATRFCNRFKLLLIGNEQVGKTTLLKCLRSKEKKILALKKEKVPTQEPEVVPDPGLEIKVWLSNLQKKENPIQFSCWDFQSSRDLSEITHQFFVTKKSVFLIVFDLRFEFEPQVEFWLQSIISRFPKDQPPIIIIVGSHSDDKKCTPDFVHKTLSDLEEAYANRFPSIHAIFPFASSNKRSVDPIKEELELIARDQPFMESISNAVFTLEKALLDESVTNPILPLPKVQKIWDRTCELSGIVFEDSTKKFMGAIQLLYEFGSVFYPEPLLDRIQASDQSKPDLLKDYVILDPAWLVNVFKTFLDGTPRFVNGGLATDDWVHEVWKSLAPHIHTYLFDLMDKFEICFRFSRTVVESIGSSFFPPLLRKERPKVADTLFPKCSSEFEHGHSRHYHLAFIPIGFFNRLLFRLVQYSPSFVCWRNGIVILNQEKELRALVELFPSKRELEVSVRATNLVDSGTWMHSIIEMLDLLLNYYYKIKHRVLIPCPHCLLAFEAPTMFPLEKCEELVSQGKTTVGCKGEILSLDLTTPDITLHDLEIRKIELSELKLGDGVKENVSIYKGKYKNEDCAIKLFVWNDENRTEVWGEFRREVRIMSYLQHPNIINIKCFCLSPMYLVMEFIPFGDLHQFLATSKTDIGWALRLKIAIDIAQGMAFMHSFKPPFLHRDLKSPNVLMVSLSVNSPICGKVADFGTACLYLGVQEGKHRVIDNPTWLAPEVIKHFCYTVQSDVYAFGIILWELLTGRRPFENVKFMYEIEDRIANGERLPIPPDCPPQYSNLMQLCWHFNPNFRPSFEECLFSLLVMRDEYAPSVGVSVYSKLAPNKRSLSGEAQLHLFEGTFLKELKLPKDIQVLSLLWIRNQIWAGTNNGTIMIWDYENHTLCGMYQASSGAQPVTNLLLFGDSVWSISPETINVWHFRPVYVDQDKERYTKTAIYKSSINTESKSILGYLHKLGKDDWKQKWVVLRDDILYVYPNDPDEVRSKQLKIDGTTLILSEKDKSPKSKGSNIDNEPPIPEQFKGLSFAQPVEKKNVPRYPFSVNKRGGKRVLFSAPSVNDKEKWIAGLNDAVRWSRVKDSKLRMEYELNVKGIICVTKFNDTAYIARSPALLRVFNTNSRISVEHDLSKFTPDKPPAITALVAYIGHIIVALGKKILKFEDKTFTNKGTFKGHNKSVTQMIIVNGNTMWSACKDSNVRVWNLETCACLKAIKMNDSPPTSLLQVKKEVWIASKNGAIRVFNAQNYTRTKKLNEEQKNLTSWVLAWDNQVWSSSNETGIFLWN